MNHILLIILVLSLPVQSIAEDIEVLSPDGHINVVFGINDGKPVYTLSVGNRIPIKNARLGLKLDKDFGRLFKVLNTQYREIDEEFEMTWWKNRVVRNHCSEMLIMLEEIADHPKRLDIELRVYNDGIAFRYLLPEQQHLSEFIIEEDLTEFAFSDDFLWWSANGERDNLGPLSINVSSNPVFTPMVVEYTEDLYLGIHEAAIYDFANFKLKKAYRPNTLQCDLQGKSKGKTGMQTSWRAIFIGETPGELLVSNLLVNLNPPCKIKDTSWIKTGISMWDWRAWGFTAPDGFIYGLNTLSHKRFIDFAAENNIDFLLMDADWYGPEFSKDSDPTRSAGNIDIEENLRYAGSKGIGIILYLNDMGAKEYGLERVLKQFHEWGAAGVKYGFMRGKGQEKVQQTRRIIELCAKYKLMVNFHDNPIPPSGDVRTWPNVLAREYCHSQADAKYSYYPETAVSAAFINLLSGSLDMCNGWYGFEGCEERPKVFQFIPGTVAAENAKLVVFYTGLSVLPDAPENYLEKSDLFDFIKQLPDRFEEYLVLNGGIESFITVARRSGSNWYIGSLTTREPRTLKIKLDFLEPGLKYRAFLFEDADDTHFLHNREQYQTRVIEVDSASELNIRLAPGGGNAIRIEQLSTK